MASKKPISLSEAQDLVLKKQRLTPSTQGTSKEDVVDIAKSLCGIQYDPLPVIAQAHYLTLWNRIKGFRSDWLDSLLYEKKELVEFMLMRQTLNLVPTDELPYYFQATRSVARAGWIQQVIERKEDETSKGILQKIREEGTVSPRDFHYAAFRPLFYSGKIIIDRRNGGTFRMPHYALSPNHFPKLESVSEAEARRFIVLKTLAAYGISPSRHVAYWLGYGVGETEKILWDLEREHLVAQVKIEGLRRLCWMRAEDFERLEGQSGEEDFVALLTLMDNLIRDRKWLQQLFNYSFEVEYFQKKGMKWHVNILLNHEFLGFINPKFERSTKRFTIKDIFIKRRLDTEEWPKVLDRIRELAIFHDAETIQMQRTIDSDTQKALLNYGFRMNAKGLLLAGLR